MFDRFPHRRFRLIRKTRAESGEEADLRLSSEMTSSSLQRPEPADPSDRACGATGDRITQTSWEQDAIVLDREQTPPEVAPPGLRLAGVPSQGDALSPFFSAFSSSLRASASEHFSTF